MNKGFKILIGIIGVIVLLMAIPYYLATAGQSSMNDLVRDEFKKDFVQLSNGSVSYGWDGPEDGEIIVLVHGFSTPRFVFSKMINMLIAEGYRVLSYDHYGRGFSDRPNIDYSKKVYDDELMELLNALKINDPVNLVGYSMGGAIVTEFAGQHPEKVKRLVLLAPAGFLPKTDGLTSLLGVPVLGKWLMTVIGRKTLIDQFYNHVENGDAPAYFADQFAEQFDYSGVESALVSTIQNFNMSNMDSEYLQLGQTSMPKLMIWGAGDTVCPITGAEEIKNRVPNIELFTIENGGHEIAYSHAEEVSRGIMGFVEMDKE